MIISTVFCLLLALLAWIVPIGTTIKLGQFTVEILPRMAILGRRFVLGDGDRFLLILFYVFGALWFFGAGVIKADNIFTPIGLGMISLAVAALSVEPFLYAALLVEIVVLLSVPMLAPPGKPIGQGVLRYLIFQTIAMTFILLAGWAAGGVEANPADEKLLLQTVVLLGLGFAFWLAIFPFYTWIPLLTSEVKPYLAGFILSLLPLIALLLTLDFLNAFAWLRDFSLIPSVLSISGALMVVMGGLLAAFQNHLARLLAYAVILELGFSLLALSLGSQVGLQIFVSFFLPRILTFALWALALSEIGAGESTAFEHVRGRIRQKPIAGISILVAGFSLSGLPLLAGYPLRQVLFENLGQLSTVLVTWVILGSIGMLVGSFRMLSVLTTPSKESWSITEGWPQAVLLSVGIIMTLVLGLFPNWLLPVMQNLLNSFERLI
jgi:NADH:ubiquinone oxidoreductase subunit 2 (subunit N)